MPKIKRLPDAELEIMNALWNPSAWWPPRP